MLVTGGCGFIGTNFVRYYLRAHPESRIINLDRLCYAGHRENLCDLEDTKSYRFVEGSITDASLVETLLSEESIDAIVNLAAESHVDRGFRHVSLFAKTNALGAAVLLQCASRVWGSHSTKRFLQVSTDEVYGHIDGQNGQFSESDAVNPRNPYSATKAAAEHLATAMFLSQGLPVLITRSCNNYGPYQHPEKLIPKTICHALRDEKIPVFGDGMNVREWIYVEDHCRALDLVLHGGIPGQIYNVGTGVERKNLLLVQDILDLLGKPRSLVEFVEDRPGHDRRYSLSTSKLRANTGFEPEIDFASGIRSTVDWYVNHQSWCQMCEWQAAAQ